jgi:hypothetical protein
MGRPEPAIILDTGGLVARRATSLVARILWIIGLVIVAFLVLHILFVVFDANPANGFAQFIASGATLFDLSLNDLFLFPGAPKLETGVNFGIAALAWLLITNIVVGLVRRVG